MPCSPGRSSPRASSGSAGLLRIDLSSFAMSHVVPGGSAPATALSYRLLTESGVEGPDAGFALATQGLGSAVVLNAIFWVVLVISLFIHGYNPLYLVAAGVGVVLIGAFAAVVLLLLEGRERAVEVVHRLADKLPFLDGDTDRRPDPRVADRMRTLVADRDLLRRAVGWAAANWLSTPLRFGCSSRRSEGSSRPSTSWSHTGSRTSSRSSRSRPGGLGVIEGVLIPTLERVRPGQGGCDRCGPRLPVGQFLVPDPRRWWLLPVSSPRVGPRLQAAHPRGPKRRVHGTETHSSAPAADHGNVAGAGQERQRGATAERFAVRAETLRRQTAIDPHDPSQVAPS